MKDYNKNKELSYPKHWDVNNLYGWEISHNDIKLVENVSEFNEDFINSCIYESDEGCFLDVDVQFSAKSRDRHNDLLFLP